MAAASHMRRPPVAESWSTALITGAGSGVGLCLAQKLGARGVKLALLDQHFSKAANDKLKSTCPDALLLEADICDRPALEEAINTAMGATGAPDLVLNCAGIQRAYAFEALDPEDFDKVIQINLIGSRNVAAALLPHMKPGARFVFIASLAGLTPVYGYAGYNASKYGVVGLASALRLEYKPKAVGISVVCPPEFISPMVEEELKTAPRATFKMKEFAGTLSAEHVADVILAKARAGKWMIIPGKRARLTALLARLFPGLMNRISDDMVRKALR